MKYMIALSISVGMFLLWWHRIRPCGDLADAPPEPVQTDIYIEDLWMSLFERECCE